MNAPTPASPASGLPPQDAKAAGTVVGPAVTAGAGATRGIVIGIAAGWVAAGLYIAPIATLVWLTGVSALTAAAWFFANWLDQKLYDRIQKGQCAHCGYDLRGCGERGECPECGAWFGPGWGAVLKNKTAKPPEMSAAAQSAQAIIQAPPAADVNVNKADAPAPAVTPSPQTSTAPAAERTSA
jgi:hypothetical protein